jgi:hypothetical protein
VRLRLTRVTGFLYLAASIAVVVGWLAGIDWLETV